MNDEHFMKIALREAHTAFEMGEVPIGAVVVLDGSIIARGHNQTELLKDSTAHAEMIALTSAFSALNSKYLPNATLYVTVEPCLMCCGALYWSKIGRVVFGASDDKNGYHRYFNNNPQPISVFHPKTQLTFGILAQESAALMKEFFQARR